MTIRRLTAMCSLLCLMGLTACSDDDDGAFNLEEYIQHHATEAGFEEWENLEGQESHVVETMELEQSVYRNRFRVEAPRSLVSFGDSITQAAMATLPRSQAGKWWVQIQLPIIGIKALFLKSQAANTPGVSWSSGQGLRRQRRQRRGGRWRWVTERTYPVRSHAYRLQEQFGRTLKVANVAESGAESKDLKAQIGRLLKFSRDHLDGDMPDYSTLLIGGNDVCTRRRENWEDSMTAVDELYADVEEVVETVLGGSDNSRMLIAALPQIEALQAVGQDASLRLVSKITAAIIPGLKPISTCRQFWEGPGKSLCDNIFNERDPLKRDLIRQKVVEYNEALMDLVDKKRELYGDRIRFSLAPIESAFNKDDLAMDCFHPNVNGQNRLSAGIWQDSWWAE